MLIKENDKELWEIGTNHKRKIVAICATQEDQKRILDINEGLGVCLQTICDDCKHDGGCTGCRFDELQKLSY